MLRRYNRGVGGLSACVVGDNTLLNPLSRSVFVLSIQCLESCTVSHSFFDR